MGTPIRTAGMAITTDIAGTEVTTIIDIIDTGAITTRNSDRFDDPATCPGHSMSRRAAQRCPLAMRDVRTTSRRDVRVTPKSGHWLSYFCGVRFKTGPGSQFVFITFFAISQSICGLISFWNASATFLYSRLHRGDRVGGK